MVPRKKGQFFLQFVDVLYLELPSIHVISRPFQSLVRISVTGFLSVVIADGESPLELVEGVDLFVSLPLGASGGRGSAA